MSKIIPGNQKHMTLDDRIFIEKGLEQHHSLRSIALSLGKDPFVCNGCDKKTGCRMDKAFYKAATSHRQYKTVLAKSRTGIIISPEDLILLDELVSPLFLQGHSPYMILQNHPEITLSEKTIYNYIESGALSFKNIDLPKKVKYKVRTSHPSESVDSEIYEGRTYKDYQAFF